ncbi:MAG: DUF485 domain-containing protein [Gammaproteobacteria bacterium]|jgi:uncharacterized membrane protein (DUF485 family)|nr:DUF485 domain-containing protein [Gammaproteobacteria bacterium]
MSKHHYDHVRGNEKFHELVALKSKLSWSLAALMMIVYYSFILVIAFFPEWLGTPLSANSTMTWGLPVGIGIILFTFFITGIYVHRANNIYDGLMQKVIDASHDHVNNMPSDEGESSS